MSDPASDPSPPTGWEGILEDGEQILWQGRPMPGADWRTLLHVGTATGLFVVGFGVFWTVMALTFVGAASNAPAAFRLLFPLFGIVFVATAFWGVFGDFVTSAARNRGTFYTLTNRAAYIATDIAGRRSLDRYPVNEMSFLTLELSGVGSVLFGRKENIHRSNGRRATRMRQVGFERISDAKDVYGILRDLRRDSKDRRNDRAD